MKRVVLSALMAMALMILAGTVAAQSAEGTGERQTYSDTITNLTPFHEYPFTVEEAGNTIILDVQPTPEFQGQLDTYLYLVDANGNIVAENDDRERGDLSSRLEFPRAEPGDYRAIVTRYGVAEGTSTGDFNLVIEIKPGGTAAPISFDTSQQALQNAGFPSLEPRPEADWTVLAYYGGDNSLEPSLQFDLDEFERAGGSNETVRVLLMLDRHPEYSEANGDWRTMRIFEVQADVSDDHTVTFPPTIDSESIADLGVTDTGSGEALARFLVWGVQNYPAQNYAVSLASHGAAWQGIITDDSAADSEGNPAPSIISVPELNEAFRLAKEAAGKDRFAMLINDACSMSSIEYYSSVAPHFDLSLASPEIIVDPALDMTMLVENLRDQPYNTDVRAISTELVNHYIDVDMRESGDSDVEYFSHAVTDLSQFDPVTQAVRNFAQVFNQDPALYADALGAARTNAYTYTHFSGSTTRVDLGNLMQRVVVNARDDELIGAAQDVLTALDQAILHRRGGDQINNDELAYYSIFFPERSDNLENRYFEESPVPEWGEMLRSYYNAVTPQVWTGTGLDIPFHEPKAPQLSIVDVYPNDTANILNPLNFEFELVGRNISHTDVTFDRVLDDGTVVRYGRERVLTTVFNEDGTSSRINDWDDGVNITNLAWDVALPVVSDGSSSNNELLIVTEDVAFLDGLYREPGSEQFNEVSVIFDNARNNEDGTGREQRVINRNTGSSALAAISIPPGSEFITFRSVVTSDGRVVKERGNRYTWPEGGLTYSEEPAPSGQYNLGILAEAFGGTTGFASRSVTVDNSSVDNTSLRADTVMQDGFTVTHPKSWSFLNIDQDVQAFRSTSFDGRSNISVYIAIEDNPEGNIEAVVDEVFGFYFPDQTWDRQYTETTIGGKQALEFTFTYPSDNGTYTARAFAVYHEQSGFGYVFTAETLNAPASIEPIYNQLKENVRFFDPGEATADANSQWHFSYFRQEGRAPFTDEVEYPIPSDWQTTGSGPWTRYSPGSNPDSDTFVSFFTSPNADVSGVLSTVVASRIRPNADSYTQQAERTVTSDNHTWTARIYDVTRSGTTYKGRLYATIENNKSYLIRMETPATEGAEATYTDTLEPIINGFIINPIEEEDEGSGG